MNVYTVLIQKKKHFFIYQKCKNKKLKIYKKIIKQNKTFLTTYL